MSDWRCVEDDPPPKDGTAILLCWAIDAAGQPIDWDKDLKTAGVFVQVASWWGEDAAWIVYCSQIHEPRLHFDPTHWMPLPAPPTGDAA